MRLSTLSCALTLFSFLRVATAYYDDDDQHQAPYSYGNDEQEYDTAPYGDMDGQQDYYNPPQSGDRGWQGYEPRVPDGRKLQDYNEAPGPIDHADEYADDGSMGSDDRSEDLEGDETDGDYGSGSETESNAEEEQLYEGASFATGIEHHLKAARGSDFTYPYGNTRGPHDPQDPPGYPPRQERPRFLMPACNAVLQRWTDTQISSANSPVPIPLQYIFPVTVRIVDAGYNAEQFALSANGNLLGQTSNLRGPQRNNCGGVKRGRRSHPGSKMVDFAGCLSRGFSQGTFHLPPYTTHVDVRVARWTSRYRVTSFAYQVSVYCGYGYQPGDDLLDKDRDDEGPVRRYSHPDEL